MPQFPKPFFKKARGVWYVEINRKQVNLGPDKDDAFRQYHQLMVQPRAQTASPESLAAIIDAFLEWNQNNRAPDTYEWYRQRLQRFVTKYPDMRVSALRPYHVEQWVDEYDIAVTTRRNYFRSIKRCLTWARRQGRINSDPLEELDIPGAERKDVYVPPEEFERLLTFVPDTRFQGLVGNDVPNRLSPARIVASDCGLRRSQERSVGLSATKVEGEEVASHHLPE